MRPWLGLKPDRPQTVDGIRMDPPPSEPVASGTSPLAIAAEVPPDEPPGERSVFHGLRVGPKVGLNVSPTKPASGVLVLPITTQPAARSRATSVASWVTGALSAR